MSIIKDFKLSDRILETNNQFLVVDKPFGWPVQKDLTEDVSLAQIVGNYCKHPVHLNTRLDRPVGGLTLFSKSPKAHKHFASDKLVKTYLAIVEGVLDTPTTILQNRIGHDAKNKKAFISNDENLPYCQLQYEVLHTYDRYTLLKIEISSGRFHQIRCQMAHLGFPIKGDVKYKARRSNKDKSIHLFSYQLQLTHPVSLKPQVFTADIPEHDALWALAKEIIIPKP